MENKAIVIQTITMILFVITAIFSYMAWSEFKQINQDAKSCLSAPFTFLENTLEKNNKFYRDEDMTCSCYTNQGRIYSEEKKELIHVLPTLS